MRHLIQTITINDKGGQTLKSYLLIDINAYVFVALANMHR
jgi:hypothetical protein